MSEILNNLQNSLETGFSLVATSAIRGSERIYILYIFSAIFFTLISYLIHIKKKHNVRGFLNYCFPLGLYFHKSALMDYFLFIVSPALQIFTFVPPILISSTLISLSTEKLLQRFMLGDFYEVNSLVIGIYTLIFFLVFDFAQYLAHYFLHKFWFLWEFHKIHHSAKVLIPITAYRFHPVDKLFTLSIIGALTGLCQGAFNWLYIGELQFYTVLGLNIGIFVFYLVAYNLRHSHVWLDYPGIWNRIFISPAQHQIHHSIAAEHIDKNMGFALAIWDDFFGTLYRAKEKEDISYGLIDAEDKKYQNIINLFLLPFINIFRRLWKNLK